MTTDAASSYGWEVWLPFGSLVVSCQAPDGHPMRDSMIISRLAECAELGGATAVRAAGVADIVAIAERCTMPVVGITKRSRPNQRPLITPDIDDVESLVAAGVAMIAVDASHEAHPNDSSLREVICRAHDSAIPVMGDVSTIEEGLRALALGVDLVATTLAGYTPASPTQSSGPDFALLDGLLALGAQVVLEGRVTSPQEVDLAFERGARAVVIGGAITDALSITRRFANREAVNR